MNEEKRPNPDILLHRLQEEEANQESHHKGHLKIYLGYAAGVGKTYGMLEEARNLKNHGVDVVIGLIETHGRAETEALVKNLEIVPRHAVAYGGLELDDLDLDAVLARKPTVVLVDELAHTNVPGSRYQKRFQDVKELLDAGISVLTTLNIQHIESAVDIVYQITGVRQQETVPDHILELADEIEVVDVSPEALQQRLAEGKIYIPDKAKQAMHRFFRRGNLLALRELALRYAARRVDEDMRNYMQRKTIAGPWHAGTRITVCVRPDGSAEGLVRIAHGMAADLDAPWYVVYVESPQTSQASDPARDALARSFNLAEELGGKVVILPATRIADTVLDFAHDKNITLIIVGLSRRSRWHKFPQSSVAADIVRKAGPIHVLVVGDTDEAAGPVRSREARAARRRWASTIWPVALVGCATVVCALLRQYVSPSDVPLVMLLPVVFSSVLWGLAAGLISSMTAIVAFDLFFVPPYFSFTIGDLKLYAPTFLIFIIVGVVTSLLEDTILRQETRGRQRERFVSTVYEFSHDLMAGGSLEENLGQATRDIAEAFNCDVVVLMPERPGVLTPRASIGNLQTLDDNAIGVAMWTLNQGQPAGHGTETLSHIDWSFYPLIAHERAIGVLGIQLHGESPSTPLEQRQLIDAFANILALFVARNVSS
jgi:two-component system, OmpR family, sensor histidine kinase KdpD